MAWWDRNNLRLIQNNLRETDAQMDVDSLVSSIKDLSANALMLGAGGITALYPTELEFQYKSPFLKTDMLGEAVEKCHKNGIRFIARFDFSKAHVSIYEKHPEWFYKAADGRIVNYNDMVHTCVNGYYQREYSLEIIDEVITKYPVDGIFFNMFGYQTRDYSNNYYGICNCENCRTKFMDMFGEDLPVREDYSDPAYCKYVKFREVTVNGMLDSIYNLVKGKDREIAICTYNHYKVDIIRKESNSAVDRPYPIWLYSASENVKSVEDTWKDKLISNCVINAVDIFYRFMGVSKHLIEMRLYESIASGSGLDFCIIGAFEGYPDYENFESVRKIYRFHEKNEEYFGRLESVADILLIKPYESKGQIMQEYLGIFRMLKESHILFDVICQENLHGKVKELKKYRLVIIPDIKNLDCEEALNEIIGNNSNVIATHLSLTEGETGKDRLAEIFGCRYVTSTTETRSAYLVTDDKSIFKSFPKRDWVYLDGSFAYMDYSESDDRYLPLVSPARYGPPERCGGHEISGYFGMGVKKENESYSVQIPWQPGYLYYRYGYEDHKNILLDMLDHITGGQSILTTDAPKNVEVFFNKCGGGQYLLQLLNLSGFNGTTFYEPNPVHNICVKIKGIIAPKEVFNLLTEAPSVYYCENGELHITLDKLDTYAAIVIKT